jgi:hypothetical protein
MSRVLGRLHYVIQQITDVFQSFQLILARVPLAGQTRADQAIARTVRFILPFNCVRQLVHEPHLLSVTGGQARLWPLPGPASSRQSIASRSRTSSCIRTLLSEVSWELGAAGPISRAGVTQDPSGVRRRSNRAQDGSQ